MSKKRNKRNTKSFKKSVKKKSISQNFMRKISLDLQKIELGLTKLNSQRDPMGIMLDKKSDSNESMIKKNWNRYGVPLLNLNNNYVDLHKKLDNEIKYNSETFVRYGNLGNYYHLTSPKNYKKIMKEGLKSEVENRMTSMGSNDGIWTVESDSPQIWNQVGYNQLGIGVKNLRIVVLKIEKEGIVGEISSEEVDEFTSPLHTIIHQRIIDKKFIKPIGYFLTSRSHFYDIIEELKILKSSLNSSQLKMVG